MIGLASRSETRQRMLAAAGVPFDVVSAPLDEEKVKERLRANGMDASSLALALAEAKARAAAAPLPVLGADQTLELDDGTMLDKPVSRADAEGQLRLLSGRTHRLHSAAVLIERGAVTWRATESVALTVRPLSDAFIQSYLDREYEAIRWSVGGYRIEGLGAQLFSSIEGSHFAILGLPLLPLLDHLRTSGKMPA
ncbi:Maf family protein [Allosphingosinicella flava]|uniref:Nucleoside triphosphate pyrophosphatase n=1 Tax=Allosphingosinicella flava TaxID=2771430 RepID=A0A7T2GIJ3_9SPHN|nr:Maf family protein [Sphingosinicella flava]QPQ54541.1 Maf family protein [Sphingosinicella flava]